MSLKLPVAIIITIIVVVVMMGRRLFSLQFAICIITLVCVLAQQHVLQHVLQLQQNLRIGQHRSELIGDNYDDNNKFNKFNNKYDDDKGPTLARRRLSTSNSDGSATEDLVRSYAHTAKGGGRQGGGSTRRPKFYRRKPPVNPIIEIHEKRGDGSDDGVFTSTSTLYVQHLSKIGDDQGNLKIPMRSNANEIDIGNKLHNKMERQKDNRHKFEGQDDYRLLIDVGLDTGTYTMCLLYDDPSYVLLGRYVVNRLLFVLNLFMQFCVFLYKSINSKLPY